MGLGDVLGSIGHGFGNFGRWAEKERMNLHFGSDWQQRLAREQTFLDDYTQRRMRADEEDQARKRQDQQFQEQQRKEQQQAHLTQQSGNAISIMEKIYEGGGSLDQIPNDITVGTPFPKEALWNSAVESVGRKRAKEEEDKVKEALALDHVRSQIAKDDAMAQRYLRPEADKNAEKPLTRAQALREARSELLASAKRNEFDQIINRPSKEEIEAYADDLMGREPRARPQLGTGLAPSNYVEKSPSMVSFEEKAHGDSHPAAENKQTAVTAPGVKAGPPQQKQGTPPDPNPKGTPPVPGYVRKYKDGRWGWGRP